MKKLLLLLEEAKLKEKEVFDEMENTILSWLRYYSELQSSDKGRQLHLYRKTVASYSSNDIWKLLKDMVEERSWYYEEKTKYLGEGDYESRQKVIDKMISDYASWFAFRIMNKILERGGLR